MTTFPEIAFEGTLREIKEREGRKLGKVEYRGVLLPVDLSFVPDVKVGETLLIHGRTALSRVEEHHEVCG